MSRIRPQVVFLLILLSFSGGEVLSQEEDFRVLGRWIEWSAPETLLLRYLNQENFRLIDRRESEVTRTQTREDWISRRDDIRRRLAQIVGPFPERTPLNPQITGVIEKPGYRVEKVVFESVPGFYVTGALFLPEGITEPRPGILNVIGHSVQAFRRDIYQNVILNLVAKGFVTLTIDPLGQGERLQYFDPEKGESVVGASTREHSYAGNQCFLTGYSVARYFIWDGIRAIDYLASRPEVDSSRIGVTGLSGGGTQTAYIAAMDDRVVAAAPTCYITSYHRLLESIGPQDGEQNLYHGLATGIDHAELLLSRAPKPTLVVATTRDFFSIQGVHETAGELRKVYEAFGAEDLFAQVEDDSGHGFTRKNDEATYAFLQKYLQLPGDPAEQNIPFLTEEELTITPTGQVSTSYASRGVFELNLEVVKPLLTQLEENRNERPDQHLKNALSEARRLSGYKDPKPSSQSVYRGRYQREGYTIEMHVLEGEGGTPLPMLIFVPETEGPFPAIIYLNPLGKQADATPGGPIERLTLAGYLVLAPDLLGVGETDSQIGSSHSSVAAFYSAQLAGRSVVGIHAAEVVQLISYCSARPQVSKDRIALLSIGDLGPAALLAAALEPSVRALVLSESPISYASLATNRFYEIEPDALIAGALTSFDLADLMANVAPRRLAIRSPIDHAGKRLDSVPIPSELEFVTRIFEAKGVPDRFRVAPDDVALVDLIDWSFE